MIYIEGSGTLLPLSNLETLIGGLTESLSLSFYLIRVARAEITSFKAAASTIYATRTGYLNTSKLKIKKHLSENFDFIGYVVYMLMIR